MYDIDSYAYDAVENCLENSYYYRARYYDSSVGRFISEDPIRFNSNTVNFYAYVENNPINAIDPEGERTQVCCRRLRGILGLISGQQHCYIDVQNDGHHYIFGLHKDKKLGGILRGGDADLPYPPGLGPDPSDTVKHPDKQCSDVTDATPCKERYLIEHALNPINCRGCGHNYRLLGTQQQHVCIRHAQGIWHDSTTRIESAGIYQALMPSGGGNHAHEVGCKHIGSFHQLLCGVSKQHA